MIGEGVRLKSDLFWRRMLCTTLKMQYLGCMITVFLLRFLFPSLFFFTVPPQNDFIEGKMHSSQPQTC